MPKKVLITGGGGFVGRHVIDHILVATDWDIVTIDRSYVYPVSPRMKTIQRDLCLPMSIIDVGSVDYIINLASDADVNRSVLQPNACFLNNTKLMNSVLEYAVDTTPEKMIHISTNEIYGPSEIGSKEWDTFLPANPYAASKAMQECMAISYWRTFHVPVAILNCMNIFGEDQPYNKMISVAIDLLSNGNSVPIFTKREDGGWIPSIRQWLYVKNMADFIVFTLQNIDFEMYPEYDRPTKFNVGGEEEIDNIDLVEKIAEILDVEPSFIFKDLNFERPGHDFSFRLDVNKMYQTGWNPLFSFDEALERVVEWETR